jgi:hypothetical protein
MLKNALLLCAALASASHALAQTPPTPDTSLPPLPRAADLSSSDIGQHFLLRQDTGVEEEVFFVGSGPTGASIALSATDVPAIRKTYDDTMAHCLAKGPGWRMPSIDELRVVSQFADEPEPDYLPGSYWTLSIAPCFDCQQPNRYKLAYDIRSGNVRNAYNAPIYRFYPVCVYDIR